MLPRKPTKGKIVANILAFIVLVAISLGVFVFRQRINDQIIVWQFDPSDAVVGLVESVELSDEGEFLLYASQPELEQAAEFNDYCSKIENTTSILGCYSNSKIYIYNITDARLNGIREVTMVHEMLHAAYERLSEAEKGTLSLLLETEYEKLVESGDDDIADLMDFYNRTEPGERSNELHSIIGTTVTEVSVELENYYGRYFDDRSKIVAFNEAYNGVFIDLSERADVLAQKLETLSANITTNSEEYNAMVQQLNSDIAVFNQRAEVGDFDSWAQFNSERVALENRVYNLNVYKNNINTDVDEYNSTLNEYNSIAIESQNLYNSINSTLVEAQSI